LTDKIDDVKDRMNRLETLIVTMQTQRSTLHEGKGDNRALITAGVGIAGLFIAILVAAVSIYAALKP
jgi:hypothetical protein